MLRKYYNNTLSTHRLTQKVDLCQILSAKKSQYGKRTSQSSTITSERVESFSLLESSSEKDKLRCITNTALSPVTKISVMGTNFPSREF